MIHKEKKKGKGKEGWEVELAGSGIAVVVIAVANLAVGAADAAVFFRFVIRPRQTATTYYFSCHLMKFEMKKEWK